MRYIRTGLELLQVASQSIISCYMFLHHIRIHINVQSCLIHISVFLQWLTRHLNTSENLYPVNFCSVNSLMFKKNLKLVCGD